MNKGLFQGPSFHLSRSWVARHLALSHRARRIIRSWTSGLTAHASVWTVFDCFPRRLLRNCLEQRISPSVSFRGESRAVRALPEARVQPQRAARAVARDSDAADAASRAAWAAWAVWAAWAAWGPLPAVRPTRRGVHQKGHGWNAPNGQGPRIMIT